MDALLTQWAGLVVMVAGVAMVVAGATRVAFWVVDALQAEEER